MKIIPVILAGGRGERFWPLSRIEHPKQCLSIISEKPMVVETIDRLVQFEDIFIVASSPLCSKFQASLPPSVQYVVEPFPRNTAAAIGLACLFLEQQFGDCIILIESIDHYYNDVGMYLENLRTAAKHAELLDKWVIIGIEPKFPHTGYGYIKKGEQRGESLFEIAQFREKPNLETAKEYLERGDYLWNSGVYVGKCSLILREIEGKMPRLHDALARIKVAHLDPDVIHEEFFRLEGSSIEYGVFETSRNLLMFHSKLEWDDIGDFNAFPRIFQTDDAKNYCNGPTAIVESRENIVITKKLVALVGAEKLIVVETDDAILVCAREKSELIRKVVQKVDEKYQ